MCIAKKQILIILLALATLAGCASLRVDVDVYKGPLANSEEVQIEQMASIAVGARPLLMELRNQLQENEQENWIKENPDLAQSPWIATKIGGKEDKLSNENARRVNGILSLYKNTLELGGTPPPLRSIAARFEALVSAYEELDAQPNADSNNLHEELYKVCKDAFGVIDSVAAADADFATRAPHARYEVARVLTSIIRLVYLNDGLVSNAKVPEVRAVAMSDLKPLFQDAAEAFGNNFSNEMDADAEEDERSKIVEERSDQMARQISDSAELREDLISFIDFKIEDPGSSPFRTYEDVEGADAAGRIRRVKRALIALQVPSGLEEGRLDVGLITLINNYLDTANTHQGNDGYVDRQTERERLEDALVQFANKVLIVANNEILLDNRSGNQITNARNKEQGMDGYVGNRSEKRNTVTSRGGKNLDEYVMVLQSLGNSILVAVDELTQRRAHREQFSVKNEQGVAGARSATEREARDTVLLEAEGRTLETPAKGTASTGDTLDGMLALLRYQHVQAIADHGKSSPEATHLEQAIEALYEQRSGLVYIRPSMAYLRSSTPASVLQGDPGLGWTNMLTAHAKKSVPLLGADLVNRDKERLRIMSEIDKQYWQTVNSVKVNGGGRTNYVVTKDDIGNWYVKGYSADPQDIIKGAQSLALFSLGGHFNANTFDKLRQVRGEEGAGNYYARDIKRNQLERSMDSRVRLYLDQTEAQRKELVSTLSKDGVPKRLKDTWEGVVGSLDLKSYEKELRTAIELARTQRLEPALKMLESRKSSNSDISGLLGELGAGAGRVDLNYVQNLVDLSKGLGADPYVGMRVTEAFSAYLNFITDLEARTSALIPEADAQGKLKAAQDALDEVIGSGADATKAQKDVEEAQGKLNAILEAKKSVAQSLNTLKSGELLQSIEIRISLLDTLMKDMDVIQDISLE